LNWYQNFVAISDQVGIKNRLIFSYQVETIKSLQKDVQSYKVDNERLMKAKEQQEDFNNKLM
jgi:hypothetical protein